MQTFMCTAKATMLQQHADAKHPKEKCETCFPELPDMLAKETAEAAKAEAAAAKSAREAAAAKPKKKSKKKDDPTALLGRNQPQKHFHNNLFINCVLMLLIG